MSESWRYSPLLRPAQVATALLGMCIVVDLAAVIVEINYYTVLQDLEDGIDLGIAEINAAEDRSAIAAGAQLVAYFAAAIAFIVWFRRAYRNTAGLGATGMRYKPGWSVGAWFVPILNLFRPKQISNDIWRASEPGLPRHASGWQGNEVHGLIHWWWGIWIVAGIIGNVSTRSYLSAETLSEQLGASSVAAVADVVFIVAAILAILVVRAITIRQEEREDVLRASAPQVDADPQVPPDPHTLQPA